jgi:hypothetical protein
MPFQKALDPAPGFVPVMGARGVGLRPKTKIIEPDGEERLLAIRTLLELGLDPVAVLSAELAEDGEKAS